MGRPYRLDLHRPVPIGRRRYGACVGTKSDQDRITPIGLATQLADVQFAALPAHVGEPCISDMGIVRPDDSFAVRS